MWRVFLTTVWHGVVWMQSSAQVGSEMLIIMWDKGSLQVNKIEVLLSWYYNKVITTKMKISVIIIIGFPEDTRRWVKGK